MISKGCATKIPCDGRASRRFEPLMLDGWRPLPRLCSFVPIARAKRDPESKIVQRGETLRRAKGLSAGRNIRQICYWRFAPSQSSVAWNRSHFQACLPAGKLGVPHPLHSVRFSRFRHFLALGGKAFVVPCEMGLLSKRDPSQTCSLPDSVPARMALLPRTGQATSFRGLSHLYLLA